jgi:hypothetical protein
MGSLFGFRLMQQGHILGLLARLVLLEQVLVVLLPRPLVSALVYSSFLLQRVLRWKKIEDPPHACVFAGFEASI